MHTEPTDKLHRIQLHRFGGSSLFIVFKAKIYLTVFQFLQAVIANSHCKKRTVCVNLQLLQRFTIAKLNSNNISLEREDLLKS
jgi:hypothetical protein